ncbi:MAG TPA: GNAT family N-acetyltransferase [Dehalococcoidia bacterium]|jgi:CelD/BcsL family acetyltransferase involved in cellulose biosynthesis|nr:GNAT family N-acetyltransferase [Dehalococcoidia bacterium]
MGYTVTQESFDRLTSYWADSSLGLKWGSVFVLPQWLEVWWQAFQPQTQLYLGVVRDSSEVIGIAPLQLSEGRASFIGAPDVCDYLDFIVAPGREKDFFHTLLDELQRQGVATLDLRALRPDSTAITHLVEVARSRGLEMLCREEEVSLELDLPATWEEYLKGLDKKQRHEVRRKLRRLWEAGKVAYRYDEVNRQEVRGLLDTFLRLFSLSREEKARFLTARVESFFHSLAEAMAELKLLRFGILELNQMPVAMTMGFDYQGTAYLYNSGYDPACNSLSVGLLSKVLGIKESIARGKKKWDFLKGAEKYKYQLGGREIPLYHCEIILR